MDYLRTKKINATICFIGKFVFFGNICITEKMYKYSKQKASILA